MALDDNTEEATDALTFSLPDYYKTVEGSGHWNLMESVGEQLATTNDDIQNVDAALRVKEADTIEELAELAKSVGLVPQTDENIDHFRTRVVIQYGLYSSEGTITDIITTTANALNIDVEDVDYREPAEGAENGTIEVNFPRSALDNTELSAPEVVDFIEDNIAASYTLWTKLDPRYYFWSASSAFEQIFRVRSFDNSLTEFIDFSDGWDITDVRLRPDGLFYLTTGEDDNTNPGGVALVDSNFNREWETQIPNYTAADESFFGAVGYNNKAWLPVQNSTDNTIRLVVFDGSDGSVTQDLQLPNVPDSHDRLTISDDGRFYLYLTDKIYEIDESDGSVLNSWYANADSGTSIVYAEAYSNNYLYLISDDGTGQDGHLYDLDGNQIWSSLNDAEKGTFTRDGDIIGFESGNAIRIDSDDGSQMWSTSLDFGGSPALDLNPTKQDARDEIITTKPDGFRFLDSTTGNQIDEVTFSEVDNYHNILQAFPDPGPYWSEIWKSIT